MQNRVNEKEGKKFECVYVCVYVSKEREKEKYKISQMHVWMRLHAYDHLITICDWLYTLIGVNSIQSKYVYLKSVNCSLLDQDYLF